MRRYTMRCEFVKTEQDAQSRSDYYNSINTPYARKKYPAHFTPWRSTDGSESLYVVWYWIN